MARANLNVSTEILEAFTSAQQNTDLTGARYLKVVIEGETLILRSIGVREGSSERDFNELVDEALDVSQAAFVVFCVTDSVGDVPKWLLMAWVPEGCTVREKMLYSSSREDLKKAIGVGHFISEYAANTREDANWADVSSYLTREKIDPSLYSEKERLIKEEKVLIF